MLSKKRAYTIRETTESGVGGRSTIYKLISSGQLVARKQGHRTVILADDLEAYLRSLPRMVEPSDTED